MRRGDVGELLAEFKPGSSVYLPGTVGEITALRDAFANDPERLADVSLTGCFVPGMNDFDYAALTATTTLTTFMMPPSMRASFEAGKVRLVPLPYSEIAEHIGARSSFDVAVVQVAPPGPDGRCSVGLASDFPTLAWPRAKRKIAVINPLMPATPRGLSIALDEADLVVELESPVIEGAPAPDNAEANAIAEKVAALVPDGAAIQFGIGGAPAAVLARLVDRRNLTVRSGMVIDGVQTLYEKGALASGGHMTGLALGSPDFYRFIVESDLLEFVDARGTHGAASLSTVDRFVSINSALDIDLFGQANIEWRGERLVSGVGGAPDFVRAARRSPGGRSIIALASTAGGGKISRITPRLTSPTASISRSDVDTIVTEYGVAEIADKGMAERAEALIAIAHPDHRASLADAWAELRKKL